MTKPGRTSVVEDVGNREQGNIQTHGESHNSGKGATKGRYKPKNTHTATGQTNSISEGYERGKIDSNQAKTKMHG